MPGSDDTSTPKGPVFQTPKKVELSSILMNETSLDLSILETSPSIITEEHLHLIDHLIKKAAEKKVEWEVCMKL